MLKFTDVISNNGKVSKDTTLTVKFGAKESWKIIDSAIVDLKIAKKVWLIYYPIPSFVFSTLVQHAKLPDGLKHIGGR